MEIFHISAECYPVAKVGGLADVVGALPKYQSKAGHDVRVVMPCYETKFRNDNEFECVHWGTVKLGNFNFPFSVLKEKTDKLGFELYLMEIPELFNRKDVYGYEDDIERFVTFQIATLDWIIGRASMPDFINCHDHHTGLIPFMMQYCYKYDQLLDTPSMITIHNGLYQGQFNFDKLHYLPEFDLSHGLESLFNLVRYKSKGILNGIDTQVWDPAKDKMLEKNYSLKNFEKGKQQNKETLCTLFNLDPTKPLFSFIGRLWDEKGGDLLPQASALALSENFKNINILILGSGNINIENQLNSLLVDYKGNYNTFIGYNEELAHLIYAGADFLLMPSRVEPCIHYDMELYQ